MIGAGVFGAWTALALQRSGTRVVLLDAYGPGNSRSSSGDESRIIRMGYGADEIYTRWSWRSLSLWQEFFNETGEPLFQQTGVLWLVHNNDPYGAGCAATLTRLNIPFEKLTLSDLERRYPQFALEDLAGAMLEPESGALLARRAVQCVAREATKRGVTYLQEKVQRPIGAQQLDYVLTESGERISAGEYVFACGPWLPKLFPEVLGQRIQPTRQEVFYFGLRDNQQLFSPPALPIWIDFPGEAYGFPDLENRGAKVAIDRHGPPFDPDHDNRLPSSEGLAALREFLRRRVPALSEALMTEARVCQYENTWNGDFLIDRHPTLRNVWLVGGGSGHGFKHGPMVGEYVAARVEGRDEEIEPRFLLQIKRVGQERSVF